MRKLIVTEWVSLDGIFDAGFMAQWFNPYHSDSRAQSIRSVIDDCEIMLYGRKTYEMLYPYWSSLTNNEMGVAEKLNKVKKYVVSATMKEAAWENTTIVREDMIAQIRALKEEDGGAILVQGSGQLVQALLKEGLVDSLKLLIQPHIMGTGARLFEGLMDIGLQCNEVRQLDNGVLAVTYTAAGK